ncbi:hypothetical protein ACR0S4_28790 [Priestia megaterium]|uniref:hypothetical protein n=1 Tax=Priestia megaterium TaxID=1404 RepID=UPI003D962C20
MKKISLFLSIMTIFCTFSAINVQAKPSEEFIVNTITHDFIKTHNIKVVGYKYIPMKEFHPYKDNLTTEKKSLLNIVKNIAEEQMMGDWAPIIYIDKEKKKGYALEKKLSGMNKLHLLSYDQTSKQWNMTEDVDKMGTDLADLGLLKRAN